MRTRHLPPVAVMEHIAGQLHKRKARYNWVGFYLLDPSDPAFLIVGRYFGSFAPNTRIPLDTGLCGAAARTGKTVIVHDVRQDPRDLAGSSMVVSEIVVPIFVNNNFAAELDMESYFPGTFAPLEQEFAESCAKIIGNCLAKKSA